MIQQLELLLNNEIWNKIVQIIVNLLIGYVGIQLMVILVKKALWKSLSKQSKMVIVKVIIYLGAVVVLLNILNILNVDLKVILGAAGVVGIVLGIASQASIGNIISGFLVISEKAFEVGDLITVGDKTGNVYSIDLLSVKLKTLNNLLIRIPNQTIMNTEVTNITKFPIRRMDIAISVAYKEDLKKVYDILKGIVMENISCLNEPEPLILAQNFGDSGIDILFGVWFEKSNYVKVRNSVFPAILEEFNKNGIEIPFPHISVYTGEATKAFPIKSITD